MSDEECTRVLTVLSVTFAFGLFAPAEAGDGAAHMSEAKTVAVLDAPNDFAKLAKKLGFNRVEAVNLNRLN